MAAEVGEEAGEKPKTAEVVEQQPEFADVLRGFMDRTGQTRTQAASFIGNLLDRMRIDPERRTQEAINEANRYLTLLETFPESPFKQAATEAVGMKTLRDMSTKPDPTERAAKMMEIMAPYMMMAPAMREMARAMGGGGEGEGSSIRKEFEAFKEAFRASEADKRLEERFAKLERMIEGPKEEQGGKVVDAIKELRETMTKKERDEQLALLEKQGQDLLKALDGIRMDMAQPAGERHDIVDEISAFSEKANKFFGALANTAKAMGFEKKEEIISGEDKFSKSLKFGEKVLRELGSIVQAAKQPAPPRETVETQPVIAPQPQPQPQPQEAQPQPEAQASA